MKYFITMLLIAACSSKKTDQKAITKDSVKTTPKIFVKYTEYEFTKKNKRIGIKDSIFKELSSDYIEVKLNLYLNNKLKAEVGDFIFSDEKGNDLWFNGSMEFLNFMSEHKYDLITQSRNKYSTDYTFRKRTVK